MTTDTRSPAELPDMSDAADRKAVFARALLRDVRHVFRADVDPGAEYRAKLAQQRLLGRRAEVGCARSEEHTSELQSRLHLVCRLLLEKKKQAVACLAPVYTYQSTSPTSP